MVDSFLFRFQNIFNDLEGGDIADGTVDREDHSRLTGDENVWFQECRTIFDKKEGGRPS